ncbi:MAG TPA: hypothetical protein DCQ15_06900 [Chitinophagaceae bacterium]|nr:hypothetical protein [Chitinophagaceae bacterium]
MPFLRHRYKALKPAAWLLTNEVCKLQFISKIVKGITDVKPTDLYLNFNFRKNRVRYTIAGQRLICG